jgi:hypothetical protein
VRAQALAIFAASYFYRHRQQNLLAQNVFEQQALALIVADFGFGVGDGKLVTAGIGAEGPVEQIEVARYILRHGFQAAGANQFQARAECASQAYVDNYLMLAMVLLNQFGAAAGVERGALAEVFAKIEDTGLELLLEFNRMAFQFLDVEEHEQPPRPNVKATGPRKLAKRRKYRKEQDLG